MAWDNINRKFDFARLKSSRPLQILLQRQSWLDPGSTKGNCSGIGGDMKRTRRDFLQGAIVVGAGAMTRGARTAESLVSNESARGLGEARDASGAGGTGIRRVVTPDVPDLAFEIDGSVKVFHLVAEPVRQEISPGKILNLWGYNGSAPGPTIQARQGDRVRIIVDNHLPEPTSMHWHGFDIPFGMDGGPGLSQDAISPGGRYVYEFTLQQEGTLFYHSHMAMQEMMGMIGAFIMHPAEAYDPPADKDFAIILQEYALLPNNPTPNSMSMEFNWLTLNGKSGPANTPLIVRLGDRVRLRFINLGMDHHPIHMHGHQFVITGTEGGRQPRATWGPNNTVLVGVAQSRNVEFVATNPGDWMIHCHMPHHMMNQMSSMAGPMTRRAGMPAGAGMEEGMGMLRGGAATAAENGPSMGRGMGAGSAMEQATTNGELSPPASSRPSPSQQAGQGMAGMQMGQADVSKDANSVPGFPQDAFMESPAMAMDAMVEKPETHGLRPGWSGYMQGMMTLIRVLPPERYEEIESLREKRRTSGGAAMPGMSGAGEQR
jgi:manganese oxidase